MRQETCTNETFIPFGLSFISCRNAFISHYWTRTRVFRTFVLLLVGLLFASYARAEALSLDEIRSRLLGKEVIVIGNEFDRYSRLAGLLSNWHVSSDVQTPEGRLLNFAPAYLKGKLGVVLSVELAGQQKLRGNDPFGKSLDSSPPRNPHIKIEVKMIEGDLKINTESYYDLIVNTRGHGALQIALENDSLRLEVESILEKIVGTTLYKDADTKLFDSKQGLADLLDDGKREAARVHGIANLSPLKIIDTKFLPIERAVVIKVLLPNGDASLLFAKFPLGIMLPPRKGWSPLARMSIRVAESIPKNFSRKELDAIREGVIFSGMSDTALRWSWGQPETINDWGAGGKQFVYGAGNYVYVTGNRVRDWQSIR